MHDAVYPNPCAPAQTARSIQSAKQAALEKPIRAMPNNSLSLLPEHLNYICFTWIAHMAKQRMPPNCMRVLNAIFNQTLGFKKRQDDMAGTRLQQLTHIRADHANHAVRVLEQEHAVITYTGRYGKWLSINFEFESWGKKKKIKQRYYNNDPQCLLPEYYTEEPVDAGLSMGYDDNGADESLDLSASINTAITQNEENSVASNAPTPDQNQTSQASENTAINEKILAKLQQFEDKIHGIEQQLNHAQTHTHEIINQAINEHQKTLENANQTAASTEAQTHSDNNNHNQTTVNHSSETHSNTANNNPQSSENNTVNTRQYTQNTQQNVSKENASNTQNLHYPADIDANLQQHLETVLTPTGNDAQKVLDLLARRMQNTHDPIISPRAYLQGLVQRYQAGQLDFNNSIQTTTTTPQPTQTPQLSEKEAYIQQLKDIYQAAYEDYQHIKRNMEMLRDPQKQSFEEYVESQSLDMQTLWYKIQTRLADAYDALEAAMQTNKTDE